MLDEQGLPFEDLLEDKLGVGDLNGVLRPLNANTQPLPSRQHVVYFPASVSQNV